MQIKDGVLDTSDYIRVTNRNSHAIESMYDNVSYIFKPNNPVDIHRTAATHIFCFGLPDKTSAYNRMGCIDKTLKEQQEILSNISFDEVPSPALAIANYKSRPRIGARTPLVNAGAEEGEGDSPSPTDAKASGDI